MYAIELEPEFSNQSGAMHPKRYKQVYLRVFALLANPRPPDAGGCDDENGRREGAIHP